MNGTKAEQWGTYSVKDHLRHRAFVADVILFDKLVIPRPPTDDELNGYDAAKTGEEYLQYWEKKERDPKRLRRLLDILGEFDLAVELPWAGRVEQDWQKLHDASNQDQWECGRSQLTESLYRQIEAAKAGMSEEYPYIETGSVLALYVAGQMQNSVARKLINLAKTPGVPVEPVIAYGAYSDFQSDNAVSKENAEPQQAQSYGIFGWEYFVPEDSDDSDEKLLRKAAKLASRADFREIRQYFQGWLKQIYDDQIDREDAYGQMKILLTEYNAILRKSWLTRSVRYAAKVAPVFAPIAGMAGHEAEIGAGVFANAAAAVIDKLIPMPAIPERLKSAAVVCDARKFFGKH